MKVFKLEIQRAGRPGGKEVLAIAEDLEAARRHVLSKYTGWEVGRCIEIYERPVHFTLADLEP